MSKRKGVRISKCVEQSSRGPWQGQKQTKERKEIMGISKQIQLEEISADSFIREQR
jgi:hypothetical protein